MVQLGEDPWGIGQAVILAIPFTYPVIAAKAMYTGEYAVLLFGIVYQLVFTAVIIYIASRFFSSEKIMTARLKFSKHSTFSLKGLKRK